MLDRMGLSIKSGWLDENDRVYIIFTLENVQECMNCKHDKAIKMLAELDTGKGVGLIERVKQGQGKPTIIYVRKFFNPAGRSLELGKAEAKTSEMPTLYKNDSSNNEFSDTDTQSINPASPMPEQPPVGVIDQRKHRIRPSLYELRPGARERDIGTHG